MEHSPPQLDQQQGYVLVHVLLSPREPNNRLRQAMEGYRQRVESRLPSRAVASRELPNLRREP
jgi:hypothetical protein